MKYESDLKHTTTAKARAEDREEKAQGKLRVAEDELRIKAMTLRRVSQEASEAMSSVKRLIEEFHGLRRDLQRQEAMVNQKEGVIAKLRDEACTLWASGWVVFQHKAAKVFLDLDFNFQVLVEGEAEESDSNNEADPVVFSDAPISVPLPCEP